MSSAGGATDYARGARYGGGTRIMFSAGQRASDAAKGHVAQRRADGFDHVRKLRAFR